MKHNIMCCVNLFKNVQYTVHVQYVQQSTFLPVIVYSNILELEFYFILFKDQFVHFVNKSAVPLCEYERLTHIMPFLTNHI